MGVVAPPMPSAPSTQTASRRRWLLGLLVLPAGSLMLIVLLLVILAGGAAQLKRDCSGGASPLPGTFSGPGSLGGIAGTGLTAAQVASVRSGSPYAGSHLAPGRYLATAYGPPWGGIQGAGQAMSGGIVIAGGAPRMYAIAVDPLVIGHGTLVYAWPNPFGWRGPFLAADTGGAISGRHLDFYDWRGRITQSRWGSRTISVSAAAIKPGGPDISVSAEPLASCGTTIVSGPLGSRIGKIARAHLGSGSTIAGFQPPSFAAAWCAWFATNVWRRAGVPIPVSGLSSWPYTWAQGRGLLFKRVGMAPRGPVPPAGAALMYGTGPASTSTSLHLNLVDQVNPDGTFMVTGGNQDGGRVTRYGPCRLRRTEPAYLSGPGCDTRPIYGIAAPSGKRA